MTRTSATNIPPTSANATRAANTAAAPTLAINGGAKTVTASGKERWKHTRLRDGWGIAYYLLRGQATSATGKGRVELFEKRFAQLTGREYGLTMSCGTATLHTALFAIGVGPGDEVLVPAYTWHASASAILCCGGTPVYCEIDPTTLTLDPADAAKRVTPRTKAIMAVSLWGNPADMTAIAAIAQRHNLKVIEDASHAHGATFAGKAIGAWGDIGCFSLQGGKAVSAGEGGVAVCDDPRLFDAMLAYAMPVRVGSAQKAATFDTGLMNIGPKYRPHLFGILLALESLNRLNQLNALRRRNWEILCAELHDCEGIQPTRTLPGAERGGFYEFKLLLTDPARYGGRERFVAAAKAEGAPVEPDRLKLLHQYAFMRIGGPQTVEGLRHAEERAPPMPSLPVTEATAEKILTLPAFTKVSEAYVRQVARALRKVAAALRA